MNARILALAGLTLALAPLHLEAQGVVVDQGRFSVQIGGQEVGSEEFVIRRAGLGRDDAIFANGAVILSVAGEDQEVRPLLRATPADGVADSYQVVVTGTDAIDIRLARSGRRYVATIRSEMGAEDREFQARTDTRILELGVAHHYYFVRDVREGRTLHALEPRTRGQATLTAGPRSEEDLRLGPNVVSARRIEFTSDRGDDRVIWFDRQGRVLKVEIASLDYVAERTDLVG